MVRVSLAVLLMLGPVAGVAQTAHRTRRWEVNLAVGSPKGGPRAAIAGAMVTNGFGDTSPAECFFWCVPAQAHPKQIAGSFASTLSVGYAVTPFWQIRLENASADLGETIGYRGSPAATYGTYLFLAQSVSMTALIPTCTLDELRIGLGPAVYRVKVADGAQGPSSASTKLGLVADLGVRLPAHTRFFLAISGQYRLVGSAVVGPFSGGTADTLPRFRASFTHRVLAFGLGVRW